MHAKTEPIETESNSFMRTLGELRRGKCLTEASDEIARVVQAVNKTGKPGELTLKLKIRPNADGESVNIEDSVDCKMPKADKKATNFFTNEDGQLLRNDPKQKELFQSIDGGAEPESEAQAREAVNG